MLWEAYSLHGEIPILIHEGLVSNSEQGDVPGFDRRRRGVDREQLDIQGV